MVQVLLVIHLLVALSLIGLILLQKSEGGALGIGGGNSGLVTGRAAGNLLTRATGILAAAFMVLSLTLAILANQKGEAPKSILDTPAAPAKTAPVVPATPAAPAAK